MGKRAYPGYFAYERQAKDSLLQGWEKVKKSRTGLLKTTKSLAVIRHQKNGKNQKEWPLIMASNRASLGQA